MRQSRPYPLFSLVSCFALLLAIAGCGGGDKKGSTIGPVATVTISPSSASIDFGGTAGFIAVAKDANDKTVLTEPVTWSSDNPALDIAKNGLACGGKWDSLDSPVVCTAAAAPAVATITATVGGKTATAKLYVHQHIDNVTISPTIVFPACKSQGQTQQYTATAFSGPVALDPATVGPFNFTSGDVNVATLATADQPSGQPTNQITAKAKNPGMTTIIASVAGTTSIAANFTTCSPATISLHVKDSTDTAFSIATGSTKQLAADVVDSNGKTITGLTLTFSSSSRAASVNSSGLVSASNVGQATITASCSPPTCNPGINIPIYSNPVLATVTGTAAASTIYVTSSEFTTQTPVVLPISSSNNTVGTAITLQDVNGAKTIPNSIVANAPGTRVYIGSSNGLVVIDAASNAVAGIVTSTPGKVIGVSPDGQRVVIADAAAAKTYIFDAQASSFATVNAVATDAAWTPEGLKVYLLAGGTLYQYSVAAISLRTIPIGDTGETVAMLPGGRFAYIGRAAGSLDARATCRNDSTYAPESSLTSDSGEQHAAPFALSNGTSLTAGVLDVGDSLLTVDTPTVSAPAGSNPCPPGITSSGSSADWTGSGIAAFDPSQLIVLPNGAKAYVTSDQAVLLGYDVASNTTFTVPVSGASTFTGGALSDSTKLYVGGSDGAVHVIDTATGLQSATIPITFNGSTSCAGTTCHPDLVAVRP